MLKDLVLQVERKRFLSRKIEVVVPYFRMGLQFRPGHRANPDLPSPLCGDVFEAVPFEIPPIEMLMQWHKYREDDPALSGFEASCNR
jgi:hypothetical protein